MRVGGWRLDGLGAVYQQGRVLFPRNSRVPEKTLPGSLEVEITAKVFRHEKSD